MIDAIQVQPGMAVIAPDGAAIGTVTAMHDAIVEIARTDDAAGSSGRPFVPLACLEAIRDGALVVEPHALTTIEAVIGAIDHARAHGRGGSGSLFGTSGHGTGMGGASVGS